MFLLVSGWTHVANCTIKPFDRLPSTFTSAIELQVPLLLAPIAAFTCQASLLAATLLSFILHACQLFLSCLLSSCPEPRRLDTQVRLQLAVPRRAPGGSPQRLASVGGLNASAADSGSGPSASDDGHEVRLICSQEMKGHIIRFLQSQVRPLGVTALCLKRF